MERSHIKSIIINISVIAFEILEEKPCKTNMSFLMQVSHLSLISGASNIPQDPRTADNRIPAPTYPPAFIDPSAYGRQPPPTHPQDPYLPPQQSNFQTLPSPHQRTRTPSGGDGYMPMHPRRTPAAPVPPKPTKPTAEQVSLNIGYVLTPSLLD